MDYGKVSVIIPTYNRFKFLLNAIESIKNQTYKNIEIIIVNDKSSEKEYYTHDFKDCKVIHLEKNSQNIFGFACPGGYQRNFGMKKATGEYIAFLDDDDVWLPNKLEIQLKEMIEKNFLVSFTDVYIGKGVYNKNKKYKTSINHYMKDIKYKNYVNEFKKNKILKKDMLNIGNFTSGSSCLIMHKSVIDKVQYFPIKKDGDDWEYWKNISKYYDFLYIDKPLSYIDWNHGYGYNYGRKNINKKR